MQLPKRTYGRSIGPPKLRVLLEFTAHYITIVPPYFFLAKNELI